MSKQRRIIKLNSLCRFDIHATSITLKRHRTNVKTTSCAYWDVSTQQHFIMSYVKIKYFKCQSFIIAIEYLKRKNDMALKIETKIKRKIIMLDSVTSQRTAIGAKHCFYVTFNSFIKLICLPPYNKVLCWMYNQIFQMSLKT